LASPIAREIKQASGFANMDEVRDAMPTDPDEIGPTPKEERKARKKAKVKPTPQATSADPFANDKRYQEACAEMSAFGGKGFIIRGFDAGARVLEDEQFKLQKDELRTWDNFFYVLSKKPYFDVGHPIFLALFFLVTLCSQLGWRIIERTESDFIKELFTPKQKEPERTEAEPE
jgi:hypothetical protein